MNGDFFLNAHEVIDGDATEAAGSWALDALLQRHVDKALQQEGRPSARGSFSVDHRRTSTEDEEPPFPADLAGFAAKPRRTMPPAKSTPMIGTRRASDSSLPEVEKISSEPPMGRRRASSLVVEVLPKSDVGKDLRFVTQRSMRFTHQERAIDEERYWMEFSRGGVNFFGKSALIMQVEGGGARYLVDKYEVHRMELSSTRCHTLCDL